MIEVAIKVHCDGECGETFPFFEAGTRTETERLLRKLGWSVGKERTICPECREKYDKKRRGRRW